MTLRLDLTESTYLPADGFYNAIPGELQSHQLETHQQTQPTPSCADLYLS